MQGRNGPLHDLSVTVAETGGCHIRRRVMAVQMREPLFYLSAAAMTVHGEKAAKVHENIEAEGGGGMKSAQRLVVASAMLHAQIDDFVPLRGAQRLHSLPDLTIGRMTGGVNQRCGNFNFQRLAFEQIDQRSRLDGRSRHKLGGGLPEFPAPTSFGLAPLAIFPPGGPDPSPPPNLPPRPCPHP